MTIMTAEQRELARHALGLPNLNKCSYRNRYFTGPSHAVWNGMVKAGWAVFEVNMYALRRDGALLALDAGESLDLEDFPAAQDATS